MTPNNLISIASFVPKSLRFPNAWVGHLPFAAWVIQETSPKIFVELGTHSGNSYFTFCQSVVENNLSSKCYAVDTWQGDEHAGQYNDEIFASVNAHNEKHYSEFSRLLRMTFDDAVGYFSDASIDLLHIDGLHTYEAVRHDFETWLPKLAPGAIVMFHDTNVRERNFGVWKLWEELQASHPNNLEFVHSHGLGVLQLNNAPKEDKRLEWLHPSSLEKQNLKNYFTALGSLQLERFELNELKATLNQIIVERDRHLANLNQAIAERNGQIVALHNSTSWRITQPLRIVAHQMKRIRRAVQSVMSVIKRGGGLKNTHKKAIHVYRREGLAGIKRVFRMAATVGKIIPTRGSGEYDRNDYAEWVRRYDTLTEESRATMRARIDGLAHQPLISVVIPTYNPKLEWLIEAIESVRQQIYPHWELCIADDASTNQEIRRVLERYAETDSRIKVVFREQNGHISAASNSAIELATGEWIALLDNDDVLPEQALFWIADAIANHPDAGLIYSDEDKIDRSGRRYDPYFKPDWNPDLFLSHNMICHLSVYRTDLVRRLGGFRQGYEGAQDYDLALRCAEQLAPQQIVHIPRVLYHWRACPGSTALAGSEKNYALLAGERALNDHFARTHISAKAELLDFGMYRARYVIPAPVPLVSLIIPTRNGLNLIKQCIESVFAKTTYKNYEILIVDNNSDDPETLDYFASLAGDSRIRVLRDERPFNYSTLNNAAVQQARGEYLGLLNNDIEVISPEWLNEMMGLAIQPGVGAVGARLWYPNDTLQHGGVITGLGGVAGHSHKHWDKGAPGRFFRVQLIQSLSAVTAACLVVKKCIYQKVGGLDETNLKVAFNDVDFCLRVREAGYRNVWTPYAELYHHESATRGYEDSPEKKSRFRDEVLYMQKRWGGLLMNDPAYSPNLTLDHEDFSLAWPPRIESI